MAKKSVHEIIRQEKPGFQVAESTQADEQDQVESSDVDARSRSLQDLKRKYLGENSGLDEATTYRSVAAGNDVEIVQVQPEGPPVDSDPPKRNKAVVVSRGKGKVIGEQG